MNIETIKSYILTILVLVSALLTFISWNYKPNYEQLFDVDYVDEINLGGETYEKSEVIQPESIIFKRNDNYFGFSAQKNASAFYKEIQSFSLHDFEVGETTEMPNHINQVEVIFPDSISLDFLPHLFEMDEEVDDLPEWSFQRIYISLDEEKSILNLDFYSIDGRYRAHAVVKNISDFNRIKDYIDTPEDMSEYIKLTDSDSPIYIRKGSVIIPQISATIDTTDQISLVNTLFSDPSAVRRNVVDNETVYSDGQRQMSIVYNRRFIEFVNPYQTLETMSDNELLENSLENINGYYGWTGSYRLQEIDSKNNRIRFQMYYRGYPIYNNNDLSTIEQEWNHQDLVTYNRPLFSINDPLGEEDVELPSGQKVKEFLTDESNFDLDKIQNLKIGYQLSFQDSNYYTLILKPTWYLKYNGKWQELNLESDLLNEEVS